MTSSPPSAPPQPVTPLLIPRPAVSVVSQLHLGRFLMMIGVTAAALGVGAGLAIRSELQNSDNRPLIAPTETFPPRDAWPIHHPPETAELQRSRYN